MNNAREVNGVLVLIQGAIFLWSLINSIPYINCFRKISPCPVTYFHIPDFNHYFNFFPALSIFIVAMILSLITVIKFYRRQGIDLVFVITQTGLVAFNHYFLKTVFPEVIASNMTI